MNKILLVAALFTASAPSYAGASPPVHRRGEPHGLAEGLGLQHGGTSAQRSRRRSGDGNR
jgi:hypothetical protein